MSFSKELEALFQKGTFRLWVASSPAFALSQGSCRGWVGWTLPGLVVVPVAGFWGVPPSFIVGVVQILEVPQGCLFQAFLMARN